MRRVLFDINVVLDVLLLLTSVVPVIKIGATILLLGIAVVVAPIPWPRRHRNALRRADAPRMFAALDAVATAVDRLLGSSCLLEAAQHLLDRGIADGVDRELITLRMIMRKVLMHLLVGEAEDAAIV